MADPILTYLYPQIDVPFIIGEQSAFKLPAYRQFHQTGRSFLILLLGIFADHLLQHESVALLLHSNVTIVPSHHNQSGLLSVSFSHHLQLGRGSKLFCRKLLQQQIRHFPEIHEVLGQHMPIDTHIPQIGSKTKSILIIGMPFPLQPQPAGIELITLCRSLYRICLPDIRFPIPSYRFSATVTVLIFTNDRPTLRPLHRIKMNDPPIHCFILKMYKPGFTGIRLYPSALMRAVDVRTSLRHHPLHFVRAINIL